MIVVRLMGGLGNQMFQIAFARTLSLEFNEPIYLDCNVYKKYKIRNFSLNNLYIHTKLYNFDEVHLNYMYKIYLRFTQKFYHVYQKIIRILTRSDRIGITNYSNFSQFGLYYNFDRYYYNSKKTDKKIKCIYGYFQSEKYFLKYKDQIREELKVKTPLTKKEREILQTIKSCNSVAVSIRIGDDYLTSKALNVCTYEYYYKAMDFLYSENRNISFFIFSDDVNRVKKKFKFDYPVKYIEGFNDYESLRLMYNCKDFIVSNSSFSWWGAYLSDNINKKVIAPARWYNNSSDRPDIFIDNMIIIE